MATGYHRIVGCPGDTFSTVGRSLWTTATKRRSRFAACQYDTVDTATRIWDEWRDHSISLSRYRLKHKLSPRWRYDCPPPGVSLDCRPEYGPCEMPTCLMCHAYRAGCELFDLLAVPVAADETYAFVTAPGVLKPSFRLTFHKHARAGVFWTYPTTAAKSVQYRTVGIIIRPRDNYWKLVTKVIPPTVADLALCLSSQFLYPREWRMVPGARGLSQLLAIELATGLRRYPWTSYGDVRGVTGSRKDRVLRGTAAQWALPLAMAPFMSNDEDAYP